MRRGSLTLQRRFLRVDDLTAIELWRTFLAENTIGTLPPSITVFLAQGTSDDPSAGDGRLYAAAVRGGKQGALVDRAGRRSRAGRQRCRRLSHRLDFAAFRPSRSLERLPGMINSLGR
jgi:hypothetical protein